MTDGSQAIIERCNWPTCSAPASGMLDIRSSPDDCVSNQPFEGIGA
jgi:hypothetical protein